VHRVSLLEGRRYVYTCACECVCVSTCMNVYCVSLPLLRDALVGVCMCVRVYVCVYVHV